MKLFSNRPKIFCISVQRTGTTSVGQFFKDFDYKVADWSVSNRNKWSFLWYIGDWGKIFNSREFNRNQVFEDGPWWHPGFYKFLFHYFPNAKFILLERDPHDWFNSLVAHSGGKNPGNTQIHASIYQRENDFFRLDDWKRRVFTLDAVNLLEINEGDREHYVNHYINRNKEAKAFFEQFGNHRIFMCELENELLWQKMGQFFKIRVPEGYKAHKNKTVKD